MNDPIDYYFTAASPFAYLGHDLMMQIAEKHGKAINFKPFNIFSVWEKSGSVPPAERGPVRQRYRLLELQRVADFRNIRLNAKPTHFPTDPSLADHCICALIKMNKDPASFARAVGQALWEEEKQIADENVIGQLLSDCGHAPDEVLALAGDGTGAAIREQNSQEAIANDAIGAPAYVYKGECFWGQDRLEYLEHMIASGRKAFTHTV